MNMVNQAIGMIDIAEKQGHALLKCDSVEEAEKLVNVISPDDILKKSGADILRIWVAASNYSEDLRIDYTILEQHADAYRKIRNTFRYILGNLRDEFSENDFNKINYDELCELDKLMLHKIYLLNDNLYYPTNHPLELQYPSHL